MTWANGGRSSRHDTKSQVLLSPGLSSPGSVETRRSRDPVPAPDRDRWRGLHRILVRVLVQGGDAWAFCVSLSPALGFHLGKCRTAPTDRHKMPTEGPRSGPGPDLDRDRLASGTLSPAPPGPPASRAPRSPGPSPGHAKTRPDRVIRTGFGGTVGASRLGGSARPCRPQPKPDRPSPQPDRPQPDQPR